MADNKNTSPMTESSASSDRDLPAVLEALLFAAGEPISVKDLCRAADITADDLHPALRTLKDRHIASGCALHVLEIAGGFQLATRPEFAPFIGRLLAPHANRLSKPALETVTIIAYRQPCTQAEIEAIRGVASDGVLKTLLERDLLKEAGRKATPGRPILYATTDAFLHYFGLTALDDLPPLDFDEETLAAEAREEAERTAHAERDALTAAGVEVAA
jgi:segregation and condensation protein B